MNTQSLTTKSETQVPEQNDRNALILHEQLALKRLKELHQEVRLNPARPRGLKKLRPALTRMGAAAWAALFKQPALSHQVAPGQPPVEWHGLEKARQLRAMRML